MRTLFQNRWGRRRAKRWRARVHSSSFRSMQLGTWRPRLEDLEPRVLLAADLVNDSFSVHQNADLQPFDVLANDIFTPDYEGAGEITAVSLGSEGGSVAIATDGKSLTYSPPADYAGIESITYFVDNQVSAVVSVQVEAPLRDDSFTVMPERQTQTLDVLKNDPFWKGYGGGEWITFISETHLGGELRIASDGKSVTYRAPEFASGQDSFVYIVDGKYPARVQIEIPNPIENDTYEVLQNSENTRWDVLANDSFWPGYEGDQEITFVDTVSHGDAIVTTDGQALYFTPEADYSGYATVRYVVDGQFEGTVSIYVRRPVVDDWFEVDESSLGIVIDVLSNDRYIDIFRQPRDVVDVVTEVGDTVEGGTVTILSGGRQLLYVPPADFAGQDSFEYLADGTYRATVRMQVTRPVRDDYYGANHVFQDTPDVRLAVLENDFLGEGYAGARRITGVSPSQQGGQVVLSQDRSTLFYSPPAGYTGPDSFSYTVDDRLTAQVTVSVTPLAQGDYYSECLVDSDPAFLLNVMENDHFRHGYAGPGEITEVRDVPEGDTVEILPGGQAVRLRPGRDGSHEFTYVVDGAYEASIVVSISGHAVGDSFVVDQNSDATVQDLLANDLAHPRRTCSVTGYQGNWLITNVTASREGGSVTVSEDGKQVFYEPPADYFGNDQYTYTVDGIMQATVDIHVVRRVRDDRFHVVPGQQSRLLPVLANDLFGADYRGSRKITAISSSQVGATVDIGPSGDSLIYSAPSGVVGTDTLQYVVDGRLKAEITILLRDDAAESQAKFESLDAYGQFLIDDALVRYEYLFGQPHYPWRNFMEDGGDVMAGPAALGGRDHSDTNVQVAGVDEADLIEVDADYLYVLRGSELLIAQAWPAEELSLQSRTEIVGVPIGQYLRGDRLTVVSQVSTFPEYPSYAVDGPGMGAPLLGATLDSPYRPQWTTTITVLDVSNRTAPELVQRTQLSGRYVQSRAMGDFVYVVIDGRAIAPEPEVIYPDGDPAGVSLGIYETREQYLARVTENIGQLVQDTLPHYVSYGADGQLVRSGLVSQPEDVFQPFTADATNLLSVVSIDMGVDEPGLSSNVAMYVDGADEVYASLSSLYVLAGDYVVEDGPITRIFQFRWDRQTGGLAYQATGQVPGTLVNQFSVDEHDGYLRVATTVGHNGSGNWTSRAENDLFVLQSSGGLLQMVGSLTNLALDETIQSVRFFGSQAYVVTFRTIDPLFVIDFSQPTQPTVAGHVTLPGFSSYLQVIAPDRILGVGRNTATGRSGPTQVSLFDTSDPAHPRLLDQYTFARFSTSIAEDDHHAVGYFATHQILALPSQRQYVQRTDEDGDGYPETRNWVTEEDLVLLRIDPESLDPEIVQLAAIGHSARVLRSGYIGDKLYSVGEDAIKVVDVQDPTTLVAEVSIAPVDESPVVAHPIDPIPLIPPWALRARQGLAMHLGIPDGVPLMVTAEPVPGDDAVTGQAVFRVGDQEYLYRTVDEQTVELVDDHYQFVRQNAFPGWHNVSQPEDINGDAEISPTDVLAVVQEIDTYGGGRKLPAAGVARQIASPLAGENQLAHRFLDANGDGYVSPTDALRVIQALESLQEVHNPAAMAASAFSVRLDGPRIEDRQTLDDGSIDRLFESVESTEIEDPPRTMASRFGTLDSQTVDRAFALHNAEVANAENTRSLEPSEPTISPKLSVLK